MQDSPIAGPEGAALAGALLGAAVAILSLARAAPEARPPAVDNRGSAVVSRSTAPRFPLDVNSASPAELERLPGVGPTLAGRIVAARDAAGPFRSLGELDRVPGIGPATVRRLEPFVRVGWPGAARGASDAGTGSGSAP